MAAGFSNGANMASSLILRFPETLAGAAADAWHGAFHAPRDCQSNRRPVLILSGVEDPIVGTDEVAELAKFFALPMPKLHCTGKQPATRYLKATCSWPSIGCVSFSPRREPKPPSNTKLNYQ